jgi:hypothetical protein
MDISIIPLHIAAHPQGTRYPLCLSLKALAYRPLLYTATAYAIGELGADIIRNRVDF